MTEYGLPRFSNRLSWSFSPNVLSVEIARKRNARERLLDLTLSNPTLALSTYPHAEIAAAFSEISDFGYHPLAQGLPTARDAVAEYYAAKDIVIPSDRVLLTASTSEAYALLFKLLCDPRDEVLIPVPSYPLFEYLAGLESVQTKPYRLQYDGSWFIDMDDLEHGITGNTRAIILVDPNNPTGSVINRTQIEKICEIAIRYRLPLIWDEVFADYPLQGSAQAPDVEPPVLSFRLNGLSKVAGMPQMKLGWMTVNGPEKDCAAALTALDLIADTYLTVGMPVQRALPALFRIGKGVRENLLATAKQNLKTAHQLLANSPVHCLHVDAGWSAILQFPRIVPEEKLCLELLKSNGVIVQPGYFFDMPAESYAVVSLITPPLTFRDGINAIRDLAVGL